MKEKKELKKTTKKNKKLTSSLTDTNQYYTNDLLNRLVIPEWQWSIAVNQVVSGGGGGGDSYTKAETDTLLDAKADVTVTDDLQDQINSIDTSTFLSKTEASTTYATIVTTDDLQDQINAIDLSSYLTIADASTTYATITSLDNYYLKTETYSSTEIDTLLDEKADISYVDTQLALKVDTTTLTTDYTTTDDLNTLLDTKADQTEVNKVLGFLWIYGSIETATDFPSDANTPLALSTTEYVDSSIYTVADDTITFLQTGLYEIVVTFVMLSGAYNGRITIHYDINSTTKYTGWVSFVANEIDNDKINIKALNITANDELQLKIYTGTTDAQQHGTPAYNVYVKRVA